MRKQSLKWKILPIFQKIFDVKIDKLLPRNLFRLSFLITSEHISEDSFIITVTRALLHARTIQLIIKLFYVILWFVWTDDHGIPWKDCFWRWSVTGASLIEFMNTWPGQHQTCAISLRYFRYRELRPLLWWKAKRWHNKALYKGIVF